MSDTGELCIAGNILLNRFKLVPSQDVLEEKLHKCIDDTATCKLVVNGVQRIEYVSPRKRFDSFNIPNNHRTPVTLKSTKNSLYENTSQGGKS